MAGTRTPGVQFKRFRPHTLQLFLVQAESADKFGNLCQFSIANSHIEFSAVSNKPRGLPCAPRVSSIVVKWRKETRKAAIGEFEALLLTHVLAQCLFI